ncbi:MAG: sigma 54-interacting transcriptional regulator [Janthinobacterium lividum]
MVGPVGGRGQTVDVLLIADTNMSMDRAVTEKFLRRDLLYPLAVVPVQLPHPADRRDFPLIARGMLAKIAPVLILPDDTVALPAAQDWQGNIREHRNLPLRVSLEGGPGSTSHGSGRSSRS